MDHEPGAIVPAWTVLNFDSAAMTLGNGPANGQPEAGVTTKVFIGPNAVKAVKDSVAVLAPNSGTFVLDADHDLLADPCGANFDNSSGW